MPDKSFSVDPQRVRQVQFFGVLEEAQLQRVLATTRAITLDEGDRLFDLGQPAERFYLLLTGQIKLFRLSPEGHEKIIELVGPGKLFAEAVPFLPQQRYPVNAAALAASTLYGFDIGTLLTLLRGSNELCLALLGKLSTRLHQQVNEIDKLTLQNATLRVVSYLLERLPNPRAESAVIDLAVPKQSIASRLSITPETFSRILNSLARAGIISLHGRSVGIHDADRLREFAHQVTPLSAIMH